MYFSRQSIVAWQPRWDATVQPPPTTIYVPWRVYSRGRVFVQARWPKPNTVDAAIAATESPDTASAAAANWRNAAVAAVESPDTVAVGAANWMTGPIAAVESSDTAAVAASATIGAGAAAIESPDSVVLIGEASALTAASIAAAVESPDAAAIVGAVQAPPESTSVAGRGGGAIRVRRLPKRPTVAVGIVAIGATESSDRCAIAVVSERALLPIVSIDDLVASAEFRRKLEIERDDMELLLEL